MSGAEVCLIAKGAQDVYITGNFNHTKNISQYSRTTNFASKVTECLWPNPSEPLRNNSLTVLKIPRNGDLLSFMWLEASNLIENLEGTTFSLYLGGQQIDSQTFDYMADIWQIYMAETYSKSRTINNLTSQSNPNFFPLHFFFCDHSSFLPLVALQYYEVEIHINWGSKIENISIPKFYANFIVLDNQERNYLAKSKLEFLITQVQRIPFQSTLKNNYLNLRTLNHPVKSIFFGFEASNTFTEYDRWNFDTASLTLNQNYVFENLSNNYFHTIQGYYNTDYGYLQYNTIWSIPQYTRYYMYSFGNKVNTYNISGTCNFSRIDSSYLFLNGFSNQTSKRLKVYAVNYNVLRIQNGMGGLMFSN